MTAMKRAFVFLVLAPVTVFFAALLMWIAATGTQSLDFGCLVAGVLFLFALPMSAISWTADEFLARDFPIALRASLTAIVAATVVSAEILSVFSSLFPSSIVTALAVGGAIVMATCSLLSNDYSGQRQGRLEPVSA
ncbi:hypothetical protein [Bradyrhizobium sp. CB3481]|uniref:hypothetical protein n=1 Tax=Bradyrhizobium sp. CB3481 TaxID=3039158 RepID=UPI0024B10EAB|nr:hypothetical protein [Bradyrhizobium sp. CB3481]WFU17801.1 hypothetical protein QA643_05490 [Bradyrhizobium sp. CB3481]